MSSRQSALRVGRGVAIAAAVGCALAGSPVHAGPTIQFGEQGNLTITYALQAWYTNTSYSAANKRDDSDFYLRRNRLAFYGQYNDVVGYYFQLEAGGNPGTEHKVYARDAYVTLDFRDELRFIVGKFKNTFSRENLEACLEPLTLDRSDMLSYTPWGGTRDDGVAVWGNLLDAKLQYRFMVANGRDDSRAPAHRPRYTARVHYSFWDPEFNYGYLGTYLGTQKVFTVGASYDTQADVAYTNYPMRSGVRSYKARTVDAFLEYPAASGVYTLSGAYFDYETGGAINMTPDPDLPVNSDLKGYYVKGGYMLPQKVGPGRLQLFARHEQGNYRVKTGNAEYFDRKIDGIGVNYYLDGQKLKLTAEFSRIKFDTPNPAVPQLQDHKRATVGLQFIF